MRNKDCHKEKSALIDFIQKAKPDMLQGDYHQQLKNIPVHVLKNVKHLIEDQQKTAPRRNSVKGHKP